MGESYGRLVNANVHNLDEHKVRSYCYCSPTIVGSIAVVDCKRELGRRRRPYAWSGEPDRQQQDYAGNHGWRSLDHPAESFALK